MLESVLNLCEVHDLPFLFKSIQIFLKLEFLKLQPNVVVKPINNFFFLLFFNDKVIFEFNAFFNALITFHHLGTIASCFHLILKIVYKRKKKLSKKLRKM